MIQKKSREESEGEGSGVEILVNEAYENGPGGKGQYTHKLYHIGSHLPGWFRAILPKSALIVEEKSWNAYPYTKTIYRCPFIEKFNLEIETKYFCDEGCQENVFNLTGAELRNRTLDFIDIVKDPVSSDYKKEEDPKFYQSWKTGRGPLSEDWREQYAALNKMKNQPPCLMCAYKLCRVEFKYWGMQSKIERFIHEIGLRKTMVRAHRQAWTWQDEWYGLTMEDIRRLEVETQRALTEKMGHFRHEPEEVESLPEANEEEETRPQTEINRVYENERTLSCTNRPRKESYSSRLSDGLSRSPSERIIEGLEQLKASSSDEEEFFDAQEDFEEDDFQRLSPRNAMVRSSSMELDRMEDENPEMGSQYFDTEMMSPLDRRLELYRNQQSLGVSQSLDSSLPAQIAPPSPSGISSTQNCKTTLLFLVLHGGSILDTGQELQGSKYNDISTLKVTFDTVLRAHYPAVHGHVKIRLVPCPALCVDALQILSSLSPFSHDSHSPSAGEPRLVSGESLPMGAISLFATASPEYQESVSTVIARTNVVYNEFLKSEDGLGFSGQVCLIGDSTGSLLGYDALCRQNPYFACRQMSRYGSQNSLTDIDNNTCDNPSPNPSPKPPHVSQKTNLETIKQHSVSNPDLLDGKDNGASPPNTQLLANSDSTKQFVRHSSCPTSRRTSTNSQGELAKLEFEVTDFFMFGSPLALVLAYRKLFYGNEKISHYIPDPDLLDPGLTLKINILPPDENEDLLPKPACLQLYNLFHTTDPTASRLEPLLVDKFKKLAPSKVPRYQKFPLGDGTSVHVVESIQSNLELFMEQASPAPHIKESPVSLERRQSNLSTSSILSGQGDLTISSITAITSRWWGMKRLDYGLYCPDALQAFPSNALPYLLHASYWESTDAVAFILRQVVRQDLVTLHSDSREATAFQPAQPREKWLKRRTTIKLRNLGPNHRANDVMVLEDKHQVLSARFIYGPLDMVSLSGEKVDIHIMTSPPDGPWVYFGTEVTDNSGRLTYCVEDSKKLTQGMYPCKMIVRGDHTSVDNYLTVLPPKTEAVVFSIDGSFTASVSIMGKDPKVRAGAVDVVRHWQEMGYLIIYITARPDMQHKKVVAWLAQHNFPHAMVWFMDGITSEPLRQKTNYLKHLTNDVQIQFHAAYGSAKDITVYQGIGLQPEQIFIVGKVSKKQTRGATVLTDGYAAHLNELTHGGSRSASGNARMFIRKSCFGLPGQNKGSIKRSARRTVSLPQRGASKETPTIVRQEAVPTIGVSEYGNTVVEGGVCSTHKAVRLRGLSPRGKTPHRFETNV